MQSLLSQIKNCDVCAAALVDGVRPVVQVSAASKILIIGQAPGRRVHETGIPWNDPSGDQLREWLQVDKEQFYTSDNFGIMPMGFCFPGSGKNGDLAPRKECAPLWHERLLACMQQVQLTLLIGQYAQKYYLPGTHQSVTENVRNYRVQLPEFLALPHPSPRNRIWLKNNPWFKTAVVPELRLRVRSILKP